MVSLFFIAYCLDALAHLFLSAMTTLTNEQAFAELYYTKKVIKEVVGYSPRCWRPPFGDVVSLMLTTKFTCSTAYSLSNYQG